MKLSSAWLLLVAGLTLLNGDLQAKTLNILLLANASTQDVIQKLIHEYQQQNPETDFNVSIVQSNSITAKLNTLVTAGQPPDIFEITTAYIQNYAAQALDLGRYTDSQELLSRYLPSYRPFFTSGSKVLGVPIEATANGLFYNKKLFEKARVQVPRNESEIWTWDLTDPLTGTDGTGVSGAKDSGMGQSIDRHCAAGGHADRHLYDEAIYPRDTR